MDREFRYLDVFNYHMRLSREKFLLENNREPTQEELTIEHEKLVYYLFD